MVTLMYKKKHTQNKNSAKQKQNKKQTNKHPPPQKKTKTKTKHFVFRLNLLQDAKIPFQSFYLKRKRGGSDSVV